MKQSKYKSLHKFTVSEIEETKSMAQAERAEFFYKLSKERLKTIDMDEYMQESLARKCFQPFKLYDD